MLTSIKDALDNERYYDAVSNNINSSITMYSNVDELQNESKVFIEDAYKPLRCNVNAMTKTTTESLSLLAKISEKVLPSFNKINNMRFSFSTEGAFDNFVELVCDDAYNYIEELVVKIIELHKAIITICSKLNIFIMKSYADVKPSTDLIKQLMKLADSTNNSDIPISEFFTKGNPDITVDFIQVNDVEKIINNKFNDYLSFIEMYICKNTDKNYLSRLKEKCNILTSISTDLNKCNNNISIGLDRYLQDEGKSIKHAIDSFSKSNNKHVDNFFKLMDLEDINLWVKHGYSFIPSYDNFDGNNEFKTVFADRSKELKMMDSIIYSNNKLSIDRIDIKKAELISLSSPLTADDVVNKIKGVSISEKKPFNARDLFGYSTLKEVLEESENVILKFKQFKSDNKPDILNSIQKELTIACKTNIEALRSYQSSLKGNLSLKDDVNNLNKSLCVGLMKLFTDINTSIVAMNQLIVNDTTKKCVCMVNVNAAINNLMKRIETTLNKESK